MSSFIDSMSDQEREQALSQLLSLASSDSFTCIKCRVSGKRRNEINTTSWICNDCKNAINLLKSGIHNEDTKKFWKKHESHCTNTLRCWRNLNG